MDGSASNAVSSTQYPNSTEPTSTRHRASISCCCGRAECAYLQHNNAALAGLEKDVETAAQLGQALLERHESYMADAEADRSKMVAEIERLERDKEKVQAENIRIIEENRGLLEKLEDLNEAIADSDAHVKSLTATLESTQLEVRRLTISASRVAQLEAQIRDMESEQSQLHETLTVSQEDGRSAVQRWRKAECALRDLHDQVDRIEKEAREERERHVELLGRMERKREVERELDSAAGRLKGAAAISSLGRNNHGTGVVSHFVRDILQDNANLQLGIVELREMLQNSNEEVQNLREQVLLHQPLPDDAEGLKEQNRVPLSEELDVKSSGPAPPEFHVHHHYHVPPVRQQRETSQAPTFRRQKKKRAMIPFSILESPTRNSPRRPPISHYAQGSTSSTSTILSQTSVSIPPSGGTHRWSNQSSASAAPASIVSSLPGSPQSVYRASSIFDRVESGFDSSRPTSPESNGFSSPIIVPAHRRGPSDVSFRSISGPAFHEVHDKPPTLHDARKRESGADSCIERNDNSEDPENCTSGDSIPAPSQVPIPEAWEEPSSIKFAGGREQAFCHSAEEDQESSHIEYRRIRQSTSHESLLSVSGMDIHTLRERPSQLSFSNFTARTPSRIISTNTAFSSSPPVISRTNAIVPTVSLSSSPSSASTALLSSVAAAMNPASDSASVISSSSDNRPTSPSPSQTSNSLGKRMGGWVLGKWGVTPVPSSTEGESVSNRPTPEEPPAKASQPLSAAAQMFLSRSPGVNQKGPIPGFRPAKRAPVTIHADSIDERLLQESLKE